MYAFLICIHVIASIVLILVILLQAGRGGGLSESFGMSTTQTFFGTSAAKFLERATSICAVVFLMTCLSLAALSTRKSSSLMQQRRAREAVEDTAKASEAKQAVKPESAKTEPIQAMPAKAEPVKAEPAKTQQQQGPLETVQKTAAAPVMPEKK